MNPEENKVPVVTPEPVVVEKTELELALERAEQAEKDRDNYKEVALKRLGKLPGDAEFLNKGDPTELSVAEQVRIELLNREVEKTQEEVKKANQALIKENAELRLAIKNKAGSSMGGSGSGSSVEVKDNVFSPSQIEELTRRAKRVGADPVKFIENAKANISRKS